MRVVVALFGYRAPSRSFSSGGTTVSLILLPHHVRPPCGHSDDNNSGRNGVCTLYPTISVIYYKLYSVL